MLPDPLPHDTTVVHLARDELAVASDWIVIAAFLLILAALALAIAEMRRLSRTVRAGFDAADERTRPLLEHASGAARNLHHVTKVISSEVERLESAVGEVAGEFGKLSADVRRRVAEISALLDVAQSEAEDAVLDLAAKVRVLRRAASLLGGAKSKAGDGAATRTGDAGDRSGEAAREVTTDGR